MRERAAIDVLEFAADRHTVRDARRAETGARHDGRQKMRRGLAFDGRVGRENHLVDLALAQQRLECIDTDLGRTNAVER